MTREALTTYDEAADAYEKAHRAYVKAEIDFSAGCDGEGILALDKASKAEDLAWVRLTAARMAYLDVTRA
jgi:hypothetical protein